MPEALVITPVKDSLETTKKTIQSVNASEGNFLHVVFNDFSLEETRQYLENSKTVYGFELVNLEDMTSNPSPNYKLVLQLAQKKALELKASLIIIESDVIVKKDTIVNLLEISRTVNLPGMVGAITVGADGMYNFPYNYVKKKSAEILETRHSLSFCCTLLTNEFLNRFDFKELSSKKDWFDIYISRRSKKLGFKNYLAKNNEVLHLPHSSRPWKQLKYTNPLKYYIYKYLKNRDRI